MKNFCVMPWYSREINFSTGQETVCCWLQGKISKSELQSKFLSGAAVQECQKCWQSEDRGIESRRQMENRFLDYKMDRDIKQIEQDAVQGDAEPNVYQLFLGSTCNGTCVTCGPDCSSAWKSLLNNKMSIRQENLRVQKLFDEFAHSIDWQQAKRFNLLGGEPLLMSRSLDILRRLLNVGNTDCRVSFVTNGSVMLSNDLLELAGNFSDISCCVSIDGIGKTFEYIRYPLSWPKLLDNLVSYRKVFSEVVVSYTVSNLNYHSRDKMIQWFEQMDLRYFENYVTHPAWFNPEVRPGHALWHKFVEEIELQDRLKGIDIKDYIPELHDIIQESRNI